MSTITRLLLLAASMLFSTINFGQTRYYVNAAATGAGDGSSWGDAFNNLQNALAASQYGDEVWVAEGTYYPTAGTNRSISFNLKNGVKIFGGFMGTESSLLERDWTSNATILSGDIGLQGDSTDNSYNVVYCNFADSTTVLDGFTITGGNADSQASGPSTLRPKSGGGLYLVGSSSTEDTRPVIANCTFTGNYARFNGGGIFLRTVLGAGATPFIVNCSFQNNKAMNGGGMYKEGGSMFCEMFMEACNFVENRAINGGGFYFLNNNGAKDINIVECIFDRNQFFSGGFGGGSGGGLYEEVSDSGSKLKLSKCFFFENEALSGSAVCYIDVINTNGLHIDGCVFKSNMAYEGTITTYEGFIECTNSFFISNITSNGIDHGDGGCFFMTRTSLKATNCIISKSKSFDGGIIWASGIPNDPPRIELNNCTIFQNESIKSGLIRIGNETDINEADVNINNCIIYDNSLNSDGKLISYDGAGTSVNNTLVDVPDCASIANGPVFCNSDIIYLEAPLFLDTAAGDFRLSPCSSARNAGSNAIVDSLGILTDIEGSPRIQGGTVDMGAYESPSFQATGVTVTSLPCSPGGLGTATLTLANGCPPYFLDWGSGSDISDSSLATLSLPVGTHAITVTDGRMESDTLNVTIGTAPAITGSGNATDIACGSGMGGSASIDAVGGTGAFSFLWSNGTMAANAPNLPAGTYAVTVTDALGCTLADTVTVGLTGSLPIGISISPITCAGDSDGTATVQPIGGAMPYVWLWQGGQTTPTLDSLGGGTYFATVTDALGCTGDIEFTITPPSPVAVDIMVTQPLCFGELGFATASGSGGTGNLHYLWDNSATTASTMLSEGPHTVTVTDASGCSTVETVTIQAPPQLQVSLSVEPDMLCFGASNGTIIVTPSGGSGQYGWNGPIENLSAGTYTITVTDSNGCTAISETTIAQHPDITVTDTVMDASTPTASDGSVVLSSVSGGTGSGYQFSWSLAGSGNVISTEQNLTGVPTGDYSLTVTDSQGCTAVFNFSVDFNSAAGEALENPFGAAIVPNPSGKAGASVLLKANITSLKISVFDAVGRLVIAEQTSGNDFALPKGLAAGSYRVVLENGKERMVMNWVVGE